MNRFDPDYLALPDEEIRQLAVLITTREGVEPFVRRMVILLDSLKAGEVDKVRQMSRRRSEPEFALLLSAMNRAVREGHLFAARNTAFFAASYAYQNSLDCLLDFMKFLDRFRMVAR